MITVRKAEIAEYGKIEKFYRELINSMCDSKYKPEWEVGVYPTKRHLKNAIKKQTLFLAHQGESLAGVMILDHDCGPEYENVKWQKNLEKDEVIIIHLLGVSPSLQRKGVAKQMVSNIIEMYKKDSVKAIRLDVLKNNLPSAKLYLSTGFLHIASIKMYYEDTGLTDFELFEYLL